MRNNGGARAPSLCYASVRASIQSGDVLMFRGRGPLSALIRWGSDSHYSHCGIAAWWDHRLLVFQSASRGVEVLPASRAVEGYDGRVDWWSVRPALRPSLDRERLLDECVSTLGTPYGYRAVVRFAGRLTLDRVRGREDSDSTPTGMFCSWYVSHCFRRAGLDLCHIASDDCTSPGDIVRSGAVLYRGVLHDNPRVRDEPLPEADPVGAGGTT